MPNIVTTLKENKNLRNKVIITAAVTVGVIATAVVLSKLKDQNVDVIVLSPVEGAVAEVTSD